MAGGNTGKLGHASMAVLRYVLVLVLGAVSTSGAYAQGSADASFAPFWQSFQQAVRSGDGDRVASVTQFPVAVHGQLDSDKVRRIDQVQFKKELPRWLAQDTGMSAEPEPLRDLILRTDAATIGARAQNRATSGKTIRVGAFHFERQGDRWRLTRIYEER
jgi:hypothetical protein